ncbi:MAG TPA: NADH-ubiquinone oxidoreductase-F iron-sulfur binding region domain-containing protein [Streptosporangiales bacterium]
MTVLTEAGTPAPVLLPRLVGDAGRQAAGRARPLRRGVLTAMLDAAVLRGRGGAGFPVAAKIRAVRKATGVRRPVVVANGVESEPLSRKDALLLRSFPHLVLDGVTLLAHEVGATRAYLAVPERDPLVSDVAGALAERAHGVEVEIVEVPHTYVASESSAVLNWINGGAAVPTLRPPYEAERGVGGRPTLVQNVETVAQAALVAHYGVDWYRAVGDADEPGTFLLTVDGAVRTSGVYEVAAGTPLADLLERAGGSVGDDTAVLTGGYQGRWLRGAALRAASVSRAGMAAAGGTLGAGVVYVLPRSSCPLAETARVAGYLAEESAGQCGPCVHGLAALADAMHVLAWRPDVDAHAARRILRWAQMVRGRGACGHPDGAGGFLVSAVAAFADHVEEHVRSGPCAGARSTPLYRARP